ncbi:MAG: hypothetical protein AAB648_01150 [Patescibacteria group bacterium]
MSIENVEKTPENSTDLENKKEEEQLVREWISLRSEIHQAKIQLQKVEEKLHGMGTDPEIAAEKFLADPLRITERYK